LWFGFGLWPPCAGACSLASPPPDPGVCFDDLLELYADLNREIAALALVCSQCGRCCNFVRNDYRLYASLPERALVAARHGTPRLTPDGDCGFLRDGSCSIHPDRPLGCRTFFCDPAHKSREQDLYHEYQRRLRGMVERYGLEWEYGPFFEAD